MIWVRILGKHLLITKPDIHDRKNVLLEVIKEFKNNKVDKIIFVGSLNLIKDED